jgi:hypothetical protein
MKLLERELLIVTYLKGGRSFQLTVTPRGVCTDKSELYSFEITTPTIEVINPAKITRTRIILVIIAIPNDL